MRKTKMIETFLTVSLVLFALGIYTCLARRNALGILMGIELVLNASGLNFVAFSHFLGNKLDGHVMALFIIALAAAEAVVVMAILLSIRRRFATIDASKINLLKE